MSGLLDNELRVGAHYAAQHLAPSPGAIPKIPGIDIYGVSVPLNGIAGGDLITYVNFQDRFDLEARIQEATAAEQTEQVQALQRLKRAGGILVADVAGHAFADAMCALMLHQAFHLGALYEMDMNGEITVRLFEQINTRFLKSKTLRNINTDKDTGAFVTLIYGEINGSGRFRFINAGHPSPLIFSCEYDCFVDICEDRFFSYPPVGLQPIEDHADIRHYERALGYKKHYTLNELNLMGRGDILLLYTDGLLDAFSDFSKHQLESVVSNNVRASAKDLAAEIIDARNRTGEPTDDLSLVVIKRL